MDTTLLPDQIWIYQQMLVTVPYGTMLVDALQPDLPIVYVNPAFERLTGYAAAEIIGKNSRFLQGTDRDQAAREAMRAAIENGESCTTVVRNYRKDGSMFWNEVSLTPLFDPQGVITYYFGTQRDVTVREEAKRTVERNEQRYRQMFDSNTAIKLVLDPFTGSIKDANIAAANFYGYTREHLRSLKISDLNPLPQEKIASLLHTAATTEQTFLEVQHQLASGEIRDVDAYVSPVDTPDGLALYAILIDVTGKRQAEQALALSEARYRAVLDAIMDAYYLLETVRDEADKIVDFRIIQVNANAVREMGMPEAELVGCLICESFPVNRTNGFFDRYKRVAETGEALEEEYQITTEHAAPGWYRHQVTRVADGIAIMNRNITERKAAVEALRESEEKYRLLADNASDAIYVVGKNRETVYASPGRERLLGYSDEELRQLEPDPVLNLAHPEDHNRVISQLYTAIRQHTKFLTYDWRVRHKDGHYVWCEDHVTLLYSPDGDYLGMQVVSRDVSQRKTMEQALALNEVRYRTVLEASIEAYYLLECVRNEVDEIVDFRIVQVNQNALREMGLPEAELVGSLICERFPVNRTNGFFERYKHVVETGKALEEEYQIVSDYTAPGWYRHQVTRVGDGVAIMNQNITRHKVLADILRESEEKYRALIESSADGIMLTDESGTVVEWNTGMVILSGLTAEAAVGRKIWDIQFRFVPDDKKSPTVYANMQTQTLTALQIGEANWFGTPYDSVFARADGSLRMAQSHMFPVKTVNGYRIGGIVRDVTTRHEIETALRTNEERLRTIIDNIPVMISFFDNEGNFEYVNQHWLDRVGWTIADLSTAEDSLALFYPDPAYRQQVLEYMLQGTPGWRDFDSMTKHHGMLHTSWANVRLSDGRSIGIGQDITERQRMEQALRESEEKFRHIAENMSDGLVHFDGHNRLTYVSPSYDRQYGRSIGESLRRDPEEYMNVVHTEDREVSFNRIREAIRNHEETLTYSYRTQHKAGHYFWREDHARFEYANDGTYLGAYVVSRDITERHNREEVEYKLRLEKDRLTMLTRFFSEAVHEFSTPLSSIAMGIHLLSRSDDVQRRALKAQQMEAEIDRINRLIQSIVLNMKVESADTREYTLIDLSDVLQSECRSLQMRYRGQPALHLDIPPDLPAVMGNADYLASAFHELIENAYRFTPTDGRITVSVSSAEAQIIVDIRDTGSGIAGEDLPYIFDTFWRHDEAHTTPGFGLGLSIAKRVIERHGGTISATSTVGEGSQFKVVLPARL